MLCASRYSSHLTIGSQDCSSTRTSPYAWYSAHGTVTPASPQPAAPWPTPGRSGATWVKAPSDVWASRRSYSHLVRKRADSIVYVAVGAKTLMSPVHPRRSSRGVSVGTERKLPRCPQVMLLCSWFSMGTSVVKSMVNGAEVWMTRPTIASGPGGPGYPVTST